MLGTLWVAMLASGTLAAVVCKGARVGGADPDQVRV